MEVSQKVIQGAKKAVLGCIVIMVIQIIVSLHIMVNLDYSHLIDEYKVDIGINIFGMFLCLMLLYSCYQDDMGDKLNRSLTRLIAVLGFAMFSNMIDGYSNGIAKYQVLTRIVVTLEYIYDDLIVLVFWKYIYDALCRKKIDKTLNMICTAIMSISIVATLLNWFFDFFFYVDQGGNLIEKTIAYYSDLPGMIVYIIMLIFILRSDSTKREKLILLSFEILPIAATIYTTSGSGYSMLYPSYMLSVVLIYINVYQKRKKRIVEQDNLLTQQNMALMISQIQPHFLYNTLTTISNLCVKDPEQAEETTVMFSRYLRGNLDSLRRTEPVAFPVELDHIQIYVELEQRRFGDKLNVTYDIQDTNFLVPSLGLQPIVENSIKHGICKKTEPGNLLISSKKTEAGHVVIIEDDGVGFDPAAPIAEDGRSHVGMENVRSRLERMSGATMEVTSSPGNGCRTVITFPNK